MSTTEYYDRYWTADGYNAGGGSGVPAEVHEIVRSHVTTSARALDVGCGNGRSGGPLLLGRGASYTGVDISRTAVAAAREFGLDAHVIEDASSLPFKSGSFDFVLCMEVLEHLFRPDLAATEIRRVLRDGGIALITVPNVAYWRRRTDLAVFGRWNPTGDDQSAHRPWRDPHIRFFQVSSLQRMLQESGFDHVQVGGHDGALLRDLPGLRQLGRGGVSEFYTHLQRAKPSLLAARLHAVAKNGGASQANS